MDYYSPSLILTLSLSISTDGLRLPLLQGYAASVTKTYGLLQSLTYLDSFAFDKHRWAQITSLLDLSCVNAIYYI